jgi:hypothetical protein
MSSPIAIKYPLDLTGINPNNLVISEPQVLPATGNRAFVPNYGPFYTKGLTVIDAATGGVLVPYSQYIAAQLQQDASEETGLEICGVIVITDPNVSSNILITYQVLGGEYSYSVDALIQLIDALQIDSRSVTWGEILGKPSAFPPTQHLHDIGDTYGWEYVVDALEQLRQSILTGDDSARQNLLAYINAAVAAMQVTINGYVAMIDAHITNHANPHVTTAALVGLGNVQNYGIATQADAQAGTSQTLYLTPYAAAGQTGAVSSALAAHIANISNPHQTTKAQVGLGNVGNYGVAAQSDVAAGTSNVLYVTPLAMAAVSSSVSGVSSGLAAHVANLNNPHQTTKAAVGLGNVQNYGIATQQDVANYTSNSLYLTPVAGYYYLEVIANHTNNLSNPHQTTAAQVGLGAVNNTADINKPVSTPQQLVLNTKVTTNSAAQLGSLIIGSGQAFIYETVANAIGVRTGTGAGYNYYSFGPDGNFNIFNGSVISAGGFQPSDKDLKKKIAKVKARALWRSVEFKQWLWKENNKVDNGVIAQEVKAAFPEFITTYEDVKGKKRLAVNQAKMAFEMCFALGAENDTLKKQLSDQGVVIRDLMKRMSALEGKRG